MDSAVLGFAARGIYALGFARCAGVHDLMRLPQDLARLLVVAVRDANWFKDSVGAFLKECEVPEPLLGQTLTMLKGNPTVKIVHHLLDRLDSIGESGAPVIRKMLTRMYYWQDVHTLPDDRKDAALASIKEFQKAYKKFENQRQYQREQEHKMHDEREQREQMSQLDHAKLETFRDEFDAIYAMSDPNQRGNRFQDLMNRIFNYYSEQSKGPFNRSGEQIDGLFYFDKHWYYVEVRWKKDKANAADVSVLRDRAKAAFGGDTKALFISFNGFSQLCLESLAGRTDERVILMDGVDLRDVLNCAIAFDVLLAEKQGEIVRTNRAFVGSREIIERRREVRA